ncbi:hypothetical protein JI721_16200 [Alicyclobacillus cycloheptanicus]|uniref:Uncharacterized protein n=1 Tax=Alicyclobacillus cycloheptanicus TaxID=1457 RepID=A0ABT9XDV6_9BACL|nr:hypothetical protein [Alicyclobacillus cycloheptanicus]MDQ0188486.1 hypothetical protein [Alicyclobacillus cycloheptanicus]WDM01175.1 hypothetical protein JI721_16200 [Alicyclobacillus cycloheptanicus]
MQSLYPSLLGGMATVFACQVRRQVPFSGPGTDVSPRMMRTLRLVASLACVWVGAYVLYPSSTAGAWAFVGLALGVGAATFAASLHTPRRIALVFWIGFVTWGLRQRANDWLLFAHLPVDWTLPVAACAAALVAVVFTDNLPESLLAMCLSSLPWQLLVQAHQAGWAAGAALLARTWISQMDAFWMGAATTLLFDFAKVCIHRQRAGRKHPGQAVEQTAARLTRRPVMEHNE